MTDRYGFLANNSHITADLFPPLQSSFEETYRCTSTVPAVLDALSYPIRTVPDVLLIVNLSPVLLQQLSTSFDWCLAKDLEIFVKSLDTCHSEGY